MNVMPSTNGEVIRAQALIGRTLALSVEADRLPPDRHPPAVACPTCDEGIRTITHPVRCAECVAEGF